MNSIHDDVVILRPREPGTGLKTRNRHSLFNTEHICTHAIPLLFQEPDHACAALRCEGTDHTLELQRPSYRKEEACDWSRCCLPALDTPGYSAHRRAPVKTGEMTIGQGDTFSHRMREWDCVGAILSYEEERQAGVTRRRMRHMGGDKHERSKETDNDKLKCPATSGKTRGQVAVSCACARWCGE